MALPLTNAWDDPRIVSGMKKQLRRRRELMEAGEKPLGWKLAFGGPAALARLQTTAPLVGFLMQKAVIPSGSEIAIGTWTKPAAEPEIAVYLGTNLPAGSDRETTRAAIRAMGGAIEIADVDHPSADVEGTLDRNIYQRYVILGIPTKEYLRAQLGGLRACVRHSSAMVADTTALEALTGEIIANVQHVADLLDKFEEKLEAGQLIIAGSITPPLFVHAQDEIAFRLAPLDEISVRFIER